MPITATAKRTRSVRRSPPPRKITTTATRSTGIPRLRKSGGGKEGKLEGGVAVGVGIGIAAHSEPRLFPLSALNYSATFMKLRSLAKKQSLLSFFSCLLSTFIRANLSNSSIICNRARKLVTDQKLSFMSTPLAELEATFLSFSWTANRIIAWITIQNRTPNLKMHFYIR
jgi:hypothetical protein